MIVGKRRAKAIAELLEEFALAKSSELCTRASVTDFTARTDEYHRAWAPKIEEALRLVHGLKRAGK